MLDYSITYVFLDEFLPFFASGNRYEYSTVTHL